MFFLVMCACYYCINTCFFVSMKGVCRAIGVSNFLIQHLEELKEDCSIVPHVNQVQYLIIFYFTLFV